MQAASLEKHEMLAMVCAEFLEYYSMGGRAYRRVYIGYTQIAIANWT